tara:strand:- start:5897 stop:7624 length:1728 start_codon:yes stop_codon:yes gene_type:complete
MRILLSLLFFLISSYGQGAANYSSGQSFGESLNASCPIKDDFMTGIQGYGEKVETFTADDLDRRKETLFKEDSLEANEDLKSIYQQGVERKAYIVHPNDPLITRAYEALSNPEKFLMAEENEDEIVTEWEQKTCDEQAEDKTTHTCTHELIKASQIQKDYTYWRTHYWGDWYGSYNYYRVHAAPIPNVDHADYDGCNHRNKHNRNEFKYKKRTVSVGRGGVGESTAWLEISKEEYDRETPGILDEWTHNCTRYTAGSSVWDCRKIGGKCLEGPVIKTRDGVSFTRPCWLKEETYQCGYKSTNTCEALREQGCTQVGVRCKVKETVDGKDICRVWQKVMKCPKKTERHRRKNADRDLPGCMGGDCRGKKSNPNKDFLKALSKLALLKQIQDENDKGGDKVLSIFKGGSKNCTTSKYGYENCCKASAGWMESFGNKCKEEEKKLAKDRQNGLCVEVGKFCARKKIGLVGFKCLQEKTSFCCFPSRLSRLLQEQGRRQLSLKGERGLGWGPAEEPNCKGFTVEHLSKINFERIDTRELFAALNAKKRIAPTAAVTSRISDRMTSMVDRLGNNDKGKGA